LKPLLSEHKTIVESSHVLARTLYDFKVPKYKKIWLFSGNLKAMSPNIPRTRAHNHLLKLWHDFYESAEEVPIRDLLNASNNFLFAEFQGRYFQQTDGLAMGIPAAPDVAQLYCAFEESNEPAFKNENILLFRYYIDDILVVLIADIKHQLWNNFQHYVITSWKSFANYMTGRLPSWIS
jgi:hypothetical protein